MFVAVPFFGVEEQGLGGYLASYTKPTVIMLPFNIISELSRTLALAVRLFGNMMSGAMIIGILLTITPFLFPIVMTVLGPAHRACVQAYIFTTPGRGLHRCRRRALATARPRRRAARWWPPQPKETPMDSMSITTIAVASIVVSGMTIAVGALGPALAEGKAVATALSALAAAARRVLRRSRGRCSSDSR